MFTTSIQELRDKYGVCTATTNLATQFMTDGQVSYQLRLITQYITTISGSNYTRDKKARVFVLEDVIDEIMTPAIRNYTLSPYQVKRRKAIRERAFAELSSALNQYEKETK